MGGRKQSFEEKAREFERWHKKGRKFFWKKDGEWIVESKRNLVPWLQGYPCLAEDEYIKWKKAWINGKRLQVFDERHQRWTDVDATPTWELVPPEHYRIVKGKKRKCKFNIPWYGRCDNEFEGIGKFCDEHRGLKCVVCGKKAVRGCSHAGQFVCGAPLCKKCNHEH